MENFEILVDSSILIDFLRKQNKEKSLLWKLKETCDRISISSITVFELYAGATTNKKINDVKSLIKWFEIIDFDEELGKLAGNIFQTMRKQNSAIEFRDLFIGSTAVYYNLKIATLNKKHFDKIPEIQIIDIL